VVRDRRARRLSQLIDNANEGTASVQILYSAFLLVLLAGFGIVSGTTHKQLFLDELVSVSVGQSVQVRVSLFYVLFPLVLVFVHFQLLWQMRFSIEKLTHLADTAEAARANIQTPSVRHRLKNLVLSHTFVDRSSASAVASMIIFATTAVFPILLLCYCQLCFLPYHDEWITNLHRGLVCVDSALVYLLWPPTRSAASLTSNPKAISLWGRTQRATIVGVSAWTIFISLFVATWPGEQWETWLIRTAKATFPSVVAEIPPLPTGNGRWAPPVGNAPHYWSFGFGNCSSFGRPARMGPVRGIGGANPSWADPYDLGQFSEVTVPSGWRSCALAGDTLIPTAVFFAWPSRFHRSLALTGEVLTGEQLTPEEVLKLKPTQARLWTEVNDFDSILAKVPSRRFDGRNFSHGAFDRVRLLNADLAHAETQAADFSEADLAGGSIWFNQRRAGGKSPPKLYGANLPRSRIRIELDSSTAGWVFYAPQSSISLQATLNGAHEHLRAHIDAPYSDIYVALKRSEAPGDAPATKEPRDSSGYDIQGFLGYSLVRLRGAAITLAADMPGSHVEVRTDELKIRGRDEDGGGNGLRPASRLSVLHTACAVRTGEGDVC